MPNKKTILTYEGLKNLEKELKYYDIIKERLGNFKNS